MAENPTVLITGASSGIGATYASHFARRGHDQADLIGFGRPFLTNPDLVMHMQKGASLNPVDMSTFYTPGAKGYTDYPTLS